MVNYRNGVKGYPLDSNAQDDKFNITMPRMI